MKCSYYYGTRWNKGVENLVLKNFVYPIFKRHEKSIQYIREKRVQLDLM